MVNLLINVLTSLVRIQLILLLLVHDESPFLLLPRFFVFVFRQFDLHVFVMHLFDLSYWSSLNFLDINNMIMLLSSLGVWGIISSNILSAPFSRTSPLHRRLQLWMCWYIWWCPTAFGSSVHFSFLFFLRLDNFHLSVFQVLSFYFHPV